MDDGEEDSVRTKDAVEGGDVPLDEVLGIGGTLLLHQLLSEEGGEDVVATLSQRLEQRRVEVVLQLDLIGLVDRGHDDDGAGILPVERSIGILTALRLLTQKSTGGEEYQRGKCPYGHEGSV